MATTVKVIDTDQGYKRIGMNMKELNGRSIKIGIWGSAVQDGVAIVDYAIYNEFGTSRIPARPFMQKTFDDKKDETMKFAEFLVGKMIDGGMTAQAALDKIGFQYQSFVRATIRDAKNWAAPNADSTIAAKGSSSPLIDQGRMVNAVNFEVS